MFFFLKLKLKAQMLGTTVGTIISSTADFIRGLYFA
jgi:hypothetical protein